MHRIDIREVGNLASSAYDQDMGNVYAGNLCQESPQALPAFAVRIAYRR
jgi:hypothetical protein